MAHDYLKVLLTQNTSRTVGEAVETAYALADAMQAEADKRKAVGVPEAIRERHDFTPAINKGFERASQEEWQPDWSQAPEWAGYFAMDKDGEFYYFEQSPSMASCSWQPQSHGEAGETFNHSYKGNWQDSLRKRPQ